MLDQIFGRFFSSQWIVFAVLLVLLVGLSELAWRMKSLGVLAVLAVLTAGVAVAQSSQDMGNMLSESETSQSLVAGGYSQFDRTFFASLRTTLPICF